MIERTLTPCHATWVSRESGVEQAKEKEQQPEGGAAEHVSAGIGRG